MMPAARILDRHRPGSAFLAGLALGLSFLHSGFFWLAWLVPGLLLMLGAGQPGQKVFRVGFYGGLGNWLVSLYWLLLIPMKLHAMAAWFTLSVYLGLFYGGWCWVCWRCAPSAKGQVDQGWRRRVLWALFCAVAWTAMEFTVARFWWGFPWNPLGSSQYKLLPLIQIASVTGVGGISLILVWASVAFWDAGLRLWQKRAFLSASDSETRPGSSRSPRPSPRGKGETAGGEPTNLALGLGLPLGALAGVLVFGYVRLAAPESPAGDLKIALVQPAIPQSIIWDANERTNRLNKLCELSLAAFAQHPDLLVWPEAALPPNVLGRTRDTQELITALVRTGGVWIVFGGIDNAPRRAPGGGEYSFNTAFFVDPAGDLIARYFKRHLVVFGEYMPAVRWLPFLKYLRESGGGMEAGRHPVAFQMNRPRARMAPLICYEDVFPRESREAVDPETDFLLNLTNNGWFGASAAQWQHAVCALFRAVENGVPLVRCTNNGLTCWMDAQGRMHDVYFPGSRDIYQAGFKVVEVPLRSSLEKSRRTVFNRYGDFFGWSCAGIVVACLVWSFRPLRRKRP